jgi:predicted AlkP superfamily pyrophosphatase or phosphodiesterase
MNDMSLENDLLIKFEECWNIITELEELSQLAKTTGEIISASKLDKLVRTYDSDFANLLKQLEEYFFDLEEYVFGIEEDFPSEFESEEDEYEEGNHDFNR